ncbi:HIT family protein [Betaproteobacteria bacterium]|nr:HIT family protein [Betaproteobacteria bacterium]GHU00594.1 HIT family protein [Betaproteobacteria bacterium]GHU19661.1 HIT family protein [Betaproteobacteria bacterium]
MVDCPLCAPLQDKKDEIVWQDRYCRVIHVADSGSSADSSTDSFINSFISYPGYYRVIWAAHVAEMSDLTLPEQHHLMNVVFAVERSLRTLMNPDKINLASFGNIVPHVHWHIIARYADDRHFPESIWGQAQRSGCAHAAPDRVTMSRQIASGLESRQPTTPLCPELS